LIFMLAHGAFSTWHSEEGMSDALDSGEVAKPNRVPLFQPVTYAETPRLRVLSNYISRRYRIASDATDQLVSAAHFAGRKVGIDPLLILSVIAIESRSIRLLRVIWEQRG
jgi:soluble lytic murein transglycosylase-like protein